MKTKKDPYACTECGGDATVGLSNWSGPNGKLIGKNERLCFACGKKRRVPFGFTKKASNE